MAPQPPRQSTVWKLLSSAPPKMRADEPCLDDNLLARLAGGIISSKERDAVVVHASRCSTCRRLISDIVRDWDESVEISAGSLIVDEQQSESWIIRLRPWALAAAAVIVVTVGSLIYSGMPGERPTLVSRLTDIPGVTIGGEISLSTQDRPVNDPALAERLVTLESIIAASPDNAKAWLEVGEIRLLMGDGRKAQEVLRRVVAIDPENRRAQLLAGMAFYLTGAFDQALRAFDLILEKETKNAGALLNRAMTLEQLNKLDEALAAWKAFVEQHPTDPAVADAQRRIRILQMGDEP